jgi:hypothetical protein
MNNSGNDQRDQKFQGGSSPDQQNALNSTKNAQTTSSSSSSSAGGAATSRAMSSGGNDSSTSDINSKGIVAQVKETAGNAYQTAAEKATGVLDEKRSTFSSGLTSVADSVRKLGENVTGSTGQPEGVAKFTADYSSTAAQKIEQVANYFERKDIKAMYRDADAFARQNPLAVIGGAFVVGLLAARFLKSSSQGTFNSSSSSTPLNQSNVRELGSFGSSDFSGTAERTSGSTGSIGKTGNTGSDLNREPGRSV